MAKSMTGFGHSETVTPEYKITVEIKAVNHRYCDIGVKLPKQFFAFENQIRSVVKEYASRGKIDVYILFENFHSKKARIKYHDEIAQGYMTAMEQACQQFGIKNMTTAVELVRFPEVITLEEEETDITELYPVLEQTLRQSADQFQNSREIEGFRLKEDLVGKLSLIEQYIERAQKRSPSIVEEYRKRLGDKVRELLDGRTVDDSVLATEIAVFADKICVDEETVRLNSHIENMRETLNQTEAAGRKLDFIAQEMNREANTILSKANDKEMSELAIDLKTEIEKIREQIQNLE